MVASLIASKDPKVAKKIEKELIKNCLITKRESLFTFNYSQEY